MIRFTRVSQLECLLVVLLTLLDYTTANYVIFGGTQTVVRTRLDPIVEAGTVGNHVHDVFGGSGFSETYDYDQIIQSNCTTMPIPQDFSNYWVPSMYYVDPNNGSYTLMKSTMNIYYLIRPGPNNDTVQPFPTGLRMLAGSNERGTYNASNPADQAVSYVCLDYQNSHTNDPDWAERQDFFDHQCPDGMRAQVFFPSCWDGKNLDSVDHISHMSYPVGAYNDGSCPESHPVHLISLFYELLAPTGDYPYNGAGSWSLSNGDPLGLRFHGDFVMGWKDTNVLQEFIDNCPNAQGNVADCPAFAAVLDTTAPGACQFGGKIVDEDIGDAAPIAALPGCNKPWNGSGPQPTCANTTVPDLVAAIQPLPSGWSDLGCIAEPTVGRALVNTTFSGSNVTKAVCAATCDSEGFMYAGAEYGNQCYCGDALANGAIQAVVPSEKCNMKCAANCEPLGVSSV
ncbi:WSC-domain-containing protein [Cytidiella melzeri]|nr:WSC-domain-containing protein [Cytidiella melzeri]